MLKRGTIFLCSTLLIGLLIAPIAIGAGESEIVFEKSYTSMTPIFMSGHAGDPSWIEGFNLAGDIILGTTELGTFTATVRLFNPPMSLTERYDSGLIKMVNTIPGYGTFETNGQFLSMGSSTTATSGDMTFSWFSSISNGTSSLAGMVGLVAGTTTGNIYTGAGTGKENVLYRLSY
jgi:hypothetical protein